MISVQMKNWCLCKRSSRQNRLIKNRDIILADPNPSPFAVVDKCQPPDIRNHPFRDEDNSAWIRKNGSRIGKRVNDCYPRDLFKMRILGINCVDIVLF